MKNKAQTRSKVFNQRWNAKDRKSGADREQLEGEVCREFCTGEKALSEIAKSVGIGRESTYRILRNAASRGRFEYIAPLHLQQSFQLEKEYPSIHARVVNSTGSLDVAYQTAAWVMELIRGVRKEQSTRQEIHIGFAGGGLLRETARFLARMLRQQSSEFRELTFVFHAIVAGFNPRNPMNDPNAFFAYFADEPTLSVSFVNLLAPGIVTSEAVRILRTIKAIEHAYARAKELDIIVTSGGAHWERGCSRLCQLYKEENLFQESFAALQKAKTIGDILWRPISERGPVEIETAVRAMTLIDLRDLPGFVQNRKKVVLCLGRCGSCGQPKGEVLRAVLNWKESHFSHIVIESQTAGEALDPRKSRQQALTSRHR